MISLQRGTTDRILELGGGSHPTVHPGCLGGRDVHVDVRICNNADGKQCVDFSHDLSVFPWPLKDNEFDGAVAFFVFEHVPYPKSKGFLGELFRVVRPGSKVCLTVPNTEAQLKWIQNNPSGWDGKDFFISASENLFGSQDDSNAAEEVAKGYGHAVYLNPVIVSKLFREAGFDKVVVTPFGERATDMVIEAIKPDVSTVVPQSTISPQPVPSMAEPVYNGPNKRDLSFGDRAALFNRKYFDPYPGSRLGFYWDVPQHEITFRHVMDRKPKSVLELGCARGYILKRLEDVGVFGLGFDISKHANLTAVCNGVYQHDLTNVPWPQDKEHNLDLCFSNSFWEYVPEELVETIVGEMTNYCERGLHGIIFQGFEQFPDANRCTVKPKQWWVDRMPKGHEIVAVHELEQGNLPEEYLRGDGKTKLNIGCAWTMFHNGWQNYDIIDGNTFASLYKYNFKQIDVTKGLPFGTGVVDMIFSSHMLEHLDYKQGLSLLREFRRVIRPDGCLRLVLPDACYLMTRYSGHYLNLDAIYEEGMERFDEVNGNCAEANTQASKLWSLLYDNHKALYDEDTLAYMLKESGWRSSFASFRSTHCKPVQQMLKETTEMSYGFSLFMDAEPLLG